MGASPDVFISYPGPHFADAEALADALRARGLDVFFDGHAVRPGDRWRTAIRPALDGARMIVVLVGPGAAEGDRLYYFDEITRALDRARADGVRIVPATLGRIPPRALPLGLAEFKALPDVQADWAASAERLGALLPRPPAPLPPPPSDVTLNRIPGGGRFFEGRADELRRLDRAWLDPAVRVQAVIGVGGEGKTALIKRWLGAMGTAGYRGAARVFGWSFYSQGADERRQVSAGLFVETMLKALGDPDPSAGDPWAKGERLGGLLRGAPTLLVLDGLEPLQHPPNDAGTGGRIKDPSLATLLRELAAQMDGLCLVTSRQPLRDFTDGAPGVATLRLPPLSGAVGAQVLRKWAVQGDAAELEHAVADVKGHALAVNLLGSYVAMYEQGDIRRRDRIERLTEAEDGGGHARRVMAAYDRWLAPDDRRVLRILGLFDRAADAPALAAILATPAIEGLTEGLTDGVEGRPWLKAVKHLQDLGLLLRDGGLDAHPLVREAFGALLAAEAPDAWKAAHGRLFEHFAGRAEHQPDDLVGLEPLYRAVMHGCAAGRHREALDDVYFGRILRGNEHYSTNKLGAFAADLATLAHLFARPWSRPQPDLPAPARSWLLVVAGFNLRALGRLAEAVGPLEAGLEQQVEEQDWQQAASAAGNLSELLLTLGRLGPGADGALARARQAVDHADRSGDAFIRMANRTALADALHQRGRRAAARALFAAAERLQAEMQPGLPRLYALQGYQYGDLLLADRPAEARQRAEELFTWRWEGDSALTIALDHLLLGRAALALADLDVAREHLDAAVAGLRRAGQQDELPRGLLARAACHRAVDDLPAAAADLAEARAIAARGGMRLHLTDCDTEAARLELARGDRAEAERFYSAARDAVLDIRYHRRDPELEALAKALGLTPPDWLHQADVEVPDLPLPEFKPKKKRRRLKNPKRRK